jgi:chemotaxis protein MotB
MKNLFLLVALISIMVALFFTTCVSSKKYVTSESRGNTLQQDNANTRSQLIECTAQVKNLENEKASMQIANDSVQNDLKALTSKSKLTIADQAKRLTSLQEIIQSQKVVMALLQNSIADALMNYKTDELYIYIKNGNVYVSLEEKLLFKSGSDVVDPKGKEALKSLAKVLNTTKDINVLIEGHTDNIPINTKQFEDNWSLSTARATSIVRILTNDDGFDSNRITASGKSKFHPVKTNETADGRAGNRRTEVILSPDLKELYSLLDQ